MVKYLLLVLLFLLPLSGQAQWTRTDGLPGGSPTGFSAMGDTIIASSGGDIYFSTDEGQHWTLLPSPPGLLIYDFYTSGPNIFLRAYPTPEKRIAHSTDFGQSWTIFSYPDSISSSTFVAIGNYLYAYNLNGIFRTNNNGASWETVTSEQVAFLAQNDNGRLIGCHQNYLLQSLDQGFTWDTLYQYAISPAGLLVHENWIYIFGEYSAQGCLVSDDYGQTWNQYIGTSFGQTYSFLWHNGVVLALKGNKMLRSSDNGQSWNQYLLDYLPGVPAFAGISAGSRVLIGGDNAGVNSSPDGIVWTPSNNGFHANGSNQLHRNEGQLFAAAHGGVYQLDGGLDHWSLLNNVPLPFGMTWYGVRDFYQSGNQLVLSDGMTPWFSNDNGANWQQSDFSLDVTTSYLPSFFKLGNQLFLIWGVAENGGPIFVSDDEGEHFTPLMSLYNQFNVVTKACAMDGGNIFVFGHDQKLYRSSDAGVHWSLLADYVPVQWIDPNGAYGNYVDLLVAGHTVIISLGVLKKMLVSSNFGGTWALVDYSSNGYPWGDFGLMTLKTVGNDLVAATQNAILLSTDGGLNWTKWDDGLPGFWSATLEIHDGYLWAGLKGGGIWKRPLTLPGAVLLATGVVFNDLNLNGMQDAGEPGLPDMIVQSTLGNAYTITNADGSYTLTSNNADETIEVSPPALYWNASPAEQTASLPASDLNFALSIDPSAKDLSVSLVNVAPYQPGYNNKLTLNWRNKVPLPASNVSISLSFPPDLLDYLYADPLPATQTAGTLSWNLGNLAAGASGTITVTVKVPEDVPLDTVICATAAIGPQDGDLIPFDNNRQLCRPVVGSWDPNDKQSDPPGHITPAEIANGKPVVYTIRFQNLGTAPAGFIRIADTLDAAFEPGSFQFLGSSHPCSWTLLNEGALEFYFHNIQLPPASADEPGSHGYVQYAVRSRPDQPLGAVLRNTAHIFFDYNAPVTTNTTQLEVSLTSAVGDPAPLASLEVFPNPARETAQVGLPESGVLSVNSSDGRLVLKQVATAGLHRLDLRGWPPGKYVLVLESKGKRYEGALLVN